MAWNRERDRKAGKAMTLGSCIFGLVFSIFWCILAAASGGWFMLIFGVPFAILMGYRLYIYLQVAKEDQQKEPWQQDSGYRPPVSQDHPTYSSPSSEGEDGFCPYCGAEVKENFVFCPKCGRRLS